MKKGRESRAPGNNNPNWSLLAPAVTTVIHTALVNEHKHHMQTFSPVTFTEHSSDIMTESFKQFLKTKLFM